MMRSKLQGVCRGSTVLAAALVFASCSKDSVQLGNVYVKSQLIKAAEGGSIEVLPGEHEKIAGAKIAIPAGALARDTEITVGYDVNAINDASGTAIGPVVELGPDGTNFSAPAVVTLPYTGTINRSRLKVYAKDANGLTTIPAHRLTLDETSKTVRFQVTHFTMYQCGNGMEPPPCDATTDCGPALGLPNWTCADGTVGGPTGNCLRNDDGTCGWEVNWCPVDCTDAECGTQPPADFVCPDGQVAAVSCGRRADGTCGWDISCPNNCDPATGGAAPPGPNDPSVPRPPCSTCHTDAECPSGTLCDPAVGCVPGGESCGANTCADGEWCCNASCGICAPLGGTCTEQACGGNCNTDPAGQTGCPPGTTCNPTTGACDPSGDACGNNVCGAGEYCCNASCGTCAPFGAACTQNVCNNCTATDPNGTTTTICAPGEICAADGTCQPICGANDCGPAPGIANWMCEDGSTGGPTGRCLPVDASSGGFTPPPGGGTAPTPGDQCAWEIIWCPRACEDYECGPQPGQPTTVCPDGTIGGPTGRCLRQADGTCGWEIASCGP